MAPHATPMPAALASGFPILIVGAPIDPESALARSVKEIVAALEALGRPVVVTRSLDDAEAAIGANAGLSCLVLAWGLASESDAALQQTLRILKSLRARAPELPVLLGSSSAATRPVPLEIVEQVEGYIWVPEDSSAFIAGRIDAAARRYLNTILPPFFGRLVNFADTHEYSWHTPGHTGGTAFMKSAVGRAFLGFYGEQMLRSDLSISVGELGSLNDHSGPVGEAERYAARVFGADQTYFVIGGSSASNQMILRSAVADGDVALVDRNCHKSLNYALNVSGAVPVYLRPRRNPRGVIGPVPSTELEPAMIRKKLEESPLVADKKRKPVIAALTNSTYDGLCYDVEHTTKLLSQSVDRIHYDEAWYAYARFNPLYEGRYGMHRGHRSPDDATVTVTHSTHKLLAALSQASMIHIRPGRIPVEPALFNESFMMYTSTSPQYSIIASTDVSAKMMADAGPALTDECIREAIDFRKAMLRVGRALADRKAGDWWFQPWQPLKVNGKDFLDVDTDELARSADAWVLKPGHDWHGFGDLGGRYCMLDPIKVTTMTPGIASDGRLEKEGIPAAIVTAFLGTQGIVVEKTEPYSILTLFSVGITKGKWGTLLNTLLDFKTDYDRNAPLSEVLPGVLAAGPERYAGMGLKDLGDAIWAHMRKNKQGHWQAQAYATLPNPEMTPRRAFQLLMAGKVEKVPLDKMANRVVAVGVIPYPPGIPIVMPGENLGASDGPWLTYLRVLQEYGHSFPGFAKEVEGTEEREGTYYVYCLKK
jgi:arginine decarboxylase